MADPVAIPPTTHPMPRRHHGAVPEPGTAVDPISIALTYHQQTKHHLDRYARSLGYLDWATQPEPFRIFKGTMRVELPLAADGLSTPYADLLTPLAVPAQPLDFRSIPSSLNWPSAYLPGRSSRATAGPFAATPAAAICTPPRVMPSCQLCRISRRVSITMPATITA